MDATKLRMGDNPWTCEEIPAEAVPRELAEFVEACGSPPGMETPPPLWRYDPRCYLQRRPDQAALILEAFGRRKAGEGPACGS